MKPDGIGFAELKVRGKDITHTNSCSSIKLTIQIEKACLYIHESVMITKKRRGGRHHRLPPPPLSITNYPNEKSYVPHNRGRFIYYSNFYNAMELTIKWNHELCIQRPLSMCHATHWAMMIVVYLMCLASHLSHLAVHLLAMLACASVNRTVEVTMMLESIWATRLDCTVVTMIVNYYCNVSILVSHIWVTVSKCCSCTEYCHHCC